MATDLLGERKTGGRNFPRYRDEVDVEDCQQLMFHLVPKDLVQKFKAVCLYNGTNMRTTIIKFMENLVAAAFKRGERESDSGSSKI